MTKQRRRIGFVGLPPEEVLAPRRSEELIDLDNVIAGVAHESESALPRTTCHIIRRVLDNARALHLDEIVIEVGAGKCDSARWLATVLEEKLSIPITRTENNNRVGAGTPICDSDLPLKKKFEMILDGIVNPHVGAQHAVPLQKPKVAFWGVPAADFSIYELFPDGTQIAGWTRCLENRTPADEALEQWVPEGVSTVFFAQNFCAKAILAQHLARQYNGLFVDIDGVLARPVRAKIEAFLRFNGAWD